MNKRLRRCIVLTIVSVILSSLSGCMSSDQKQLSARKVSDAKPLLKDYIENNYGSNFKIESISTISIDNSSPLPPKLNMKATEYVKASIMAKDEKFDVIINTKSKECYDNKNAKAISTEAKNYVISKLGLKDPDNFEINIYNTAIDATIKEDCAMYFKPKESFDSLLESGNYDIYMVAKYKDGSVDLSCITGNNLFADNHAKSNIYFGIINAINDDSYKLLLKNTLATASDFENEFYDSRYAQYIDSIYVSASLSSGACFTDFKKNIVYHSKYGYELLWRDYDYSIQIDDVPVEKKLTVLWTKADHSDGTTNANGKRTQGSGTINNINGCDEALSISKKTDDTSRIYIYFNSKLINKYYVVTQDGYSDAYTIYDDRLSSQYLEPNSESVQIKIGIYQ